jgi:uncharacterized protein (DUF2147 family)
MLLRAPGWLRRRSAVLAIGAGVAFLAAAPVRAADDISGLWLTDERDGHVEIKPCGEAMCGYIASILDPKVPADARDVHNEDTKLRGRPICGLQVLGDLKDNGDAWEGWVYDPHPDRGETYSVEVKRRDANTLVVHGYLGVKLIGETKRWTRDSKAIRKCAVPPR